MEVRLDNVIASFNVGSTVYAYEGVVANAGVPVPQGEPITSAIVASDGSLTFVGIPSGRDLAAGQSSGGQWTFRYFTTPVSGEGMTLKQLEEDVENLSLDVKGLSLDDLVDVEAVEPAAGDLLIFDSSSWALLPKGNAGESMIVHAGGTVTYERSVIYAKAWGVAGTESAGEGKAANEALAAAGEGGAEVRFPSGTILCEESVKNRLKCWLRGAGAGSTTFKAAANLNADVLTTYKAGEGGQDEMRFSGFTVDGNGTNNASGRGFVVDGRKCRAHEFMVKNSKGDNFVYTQSAADLTKENGGMDFFMDDWICWGSIEGNGVTIDHHDATVSRGQSIFNAKANLETTANGTATKLSLVHCWGLAEYSFRFKGSFQAIHCEAEGASKAMVRCEVGGKWLGGQVFTSSSNRNVPGFEVTTNAARLTVIGCEGKELGTGGMFKAAAAGAGSGSIIASCICDGSSLEPFTQVFTAAEGASWSGNVRADVRMRGNSEAGAAWPVQSVTAANEIVVDNFLEQVRVTGATEIKKVKATFPGHRLVLRFTSTAKVVDGENLKLAGNLEGGENRTLTVVCDGTNWLEIARSVN